MMEITEEIRAWIDRNAGATELAADEYIDPTDGLIHCKAAKASGRPLFPASESRDISCPGVSAPVRPRQSASAKKP